MVDTSRLNTEISPVLMGKRKITLPGSETLVKDLTPVLEEGLLLQVNTVSDMQYANDFILRVRAARKKIADFFAPHIERAKTIKRTAEEERKALESDKERIEAQYVEVENNLRRKLQTFIEDQERERRKQEAALREEARKREEEDRLRLAIELEKTSPAAAEAVMATPAPPVFAPTLPKATDSLKGMTMTTTWKARVTDPMLFLRAVVDGKIPEPMNLISIDVAALTRIAVGTKSASPYPGVEFYSEKSLRPTGR